MRKIPVVLLPVLALSVLVACGGDDQPEDAAAAQSSAPSSGKTPRSSPPPSSSPSPSPPGATGSPGNASPGQVPVPASGTCEPVAESADGRYVVADAGEITLRMENGGLQMDVSSSNGWNTSVVSENEEADVEFQRGDEELDFEADLEGGRLVLQICADDDD